MAVPAGDLTLEDKRTTVNALLKGGCRHHRVEHRAETSVGREGRTPGRGGAGPTVCLAISDVVGDDLSVIGSGPTVPDPSTYRDAWNYIEQLGVQAQLTQPVAAHLKAGVDGKLEETPKPGDARLERSVTRVIGGRMNAMAGAADAARSSGYEVAVIEEPIVGDARTMGPVLLERARALAAGKPRPLCVIASGETTVKVVGKGKGGRNQEMALSVAKFSAAAERGRDRARQHRHRRHRRTDRRGRRVFGFHHSLARETAGARRRCLSGRQQCVRVLSGPGRSHHHRPRRRPTSATSRSSFSDSLQFSVRSSVLRLSLVPYVFKRTENPQTHA